MADTKNTELKVIVETYVRVNPNTGKYTVEDYDGFVKQLEMMYERAEPLREIAKMASSGMAGLAHKAMAGKFQG